VVETITFFTIIQNLLLEGSVYFFAAKWLGGYNNEKLKVQSLVDNKPNNKCFYTG